jgi:hypothetical protein
VISYAMWLRRFAGDPSAVGQTVLLNGMTVAIAAVAPKGFAGTSLDGGADFWAPITVAPVVLPTGVLRERPQRMFTIFARLRDGVGREQAEAALAVVAEQLRRLDDRAWAGDSGATRRVTVMRETDARFAGAPGIDRIRDGHSKPHGNESPHVARRNGSASVRDAPQAERVDPS